MSTEKTKTKISPPVPKSKELVEVGSLSCGDFFLEGGELCILYDDDPVAIEIATGNILELSSNIMVIPVVCTIKWEYKKKSKK